MTDSAQPIAGWYPDPENPAAERWWDGAAWSDHRRASTVAPPAPAGPPTAPPYGAVAPTLPGYGAPGGPTSPAPAYIASGYAAPPAYAPAAPTNSLAVVGLVLALAGLVVSLGGLTSLAGGVVSTLALVRASRMRREGRAGHRFGMALAGTIVGYALFLLILAGTITLFALLANYGSDLPGYGGSSSS